MGSRSYSRVPPTCSAPANNFIGSCQEQSSLHSKAKNFPCTEVVHQFAHSFTSKTSLKVPFWPLFVESPVRRFIFQPRHSKVSGKLWTRSLNRCKCPSHDSSTTLTSGRAKIPPIFWIQAG